MTDDLLSKMTRALADEHDGATAAPGATRARVVRTLAERKPRRKKWLSIGIPAFVVFGGSTAWAAATGSLPHAVERALSVFIGEAEEVETVEAKSAVKKRGKWTAPPPVEKALAPVPEIVEAEPVEEEAEIKGPAPSAPTTASSVTKNPTPTSAKPALPPEDHTALLTYQAAHRAHFQQGDCTSAVAGYRKYLREEPSGTFALEAKYNLGVCLIRMGNVAEAKRLLEPFARGAYGNYRKEKSQELIDALE